jgi:hypothetical protein
MTPSDDMHEFLRALNALPEPDQLSPVANAPARAVWQSPRLAASAELEQITTPVVLLIT